MPQLLNTTTVPPEDPTSVLGKNFIKMVVVVDDPGLVTIADNLTINAPTPIKRKVIWYKQPNWQQMNNDFKGLPVNTANIKAFSVSTKNIVADTINANEEAGYVRVGQAYSKAGLPQFNT